MWIVGGMVATVVVQAATSGEHSVSEGLRKHPWLTGSLAVVFVGHLARRPRRLARFDPFGVLSVGGKPQWDVWPKFLRHPR